MRKLQSLIALFGVIAITGAFSSPSANATVLTSDVHALKAEQTSFVDKAYYLVLSSSLLSPWLLWPSLLWRILSPWLLRLRLSSPPLLVAQWLSPLSPVVLRVNV